MTSLPNIIKGKSKKLKSLIFF